MMFYLFLFCKVTLYDFCRVFKSVKLPIIATKLWEFIGYSVLYIQSPMYSNFFPFYIAFGAKWGWEKTTAMYFYKRPENLIMRTHINQSSLCKGVVCVVSGTKRSSSSWLDWPYVPTLGMSHHGISSLYSRMYVIYTAN